MYRLSIAMVTILFMTSACEIPPRFVEESGEIDGFLARKAYRSACVGLTASDEALREYTAEKLAEYPHIKVATDCVCEALYDADAGTFDAAVATGLAGSHRDDLSGCLAPALDDTRITGDDRAELVRVLGGMDAKGGYAALQALVRSDPLPEVRAMAAGAVRPSKAAIPTLIEALKLDDEPQVRAAAAAALTDRKDDAVIEAITHAAAEDPDGGVRGEALKAAVSLKISQTDDMVCRAMLEDPDERVRLAAVQSWKGTKRKRALDCLDRRMKAEEESGAVRVALLETLGASPSDRAALMLCDNIGIWVRRYVHGKVAYEIEGADIVRAQNDRDWERSYACVATAIRQGGYSCYGRNYLGHWMRDLGGKASTPLCSGMRRN